MASGLNRVKCQSVCKPGSVWQVKPARRPFILHARYRTCHATNPDGSPERTRGCPRAIPIRSCSRWGLPCRWRYRKRGGLLPHRFTLAGHVRRSVLCGTVPGVTPAGRYPAPFSLEPGLSSPAAFRPVLERSPDRLTGDHMRLCGRAVKAWPQKALNQRKITASSAMAAGRACTT